MISIILPVYNEGEMLSKNLAGLLGLSRGAELIFVDAGSNDQSIELAGKCGRVLKGGKNRAAQMNLGATRAGSDILLFLHADTIINPETLGPIEGQVHENGLVGGCLTQRIDHESWIYRLIEAEGNFRARATKVFYGDQGIFVKKKVFDEIGGFPEVPIMEDVIFSKKLRQKGKTAIISARIIVSARRWRKQGIIKTAFLYSFMNSMFALKISPDKIKLLYDDLR